jgi:hypothetical protein
MSENLKPCPACDSDARADGISVKCSDESCILGSPYLLISHDEWNALPRRSDIAQAVKEERKRNHDIVQEACEIMRRSLYGEDFSRLATAFIARHERKP